MTEDADVRAIRALAHPLRVRLLDLLRFEGPSTATLLARRVGESSGSTSYHLRQLAGSGYIEEAPHQGRRERWWVYRERRLDLPQPSSGDQSERALLAELLSREARAVDAFLVQRSRLPEWDAVAFVQSPALRITPAELDALRRGIDALVEPLRRVDAADAPADARPVRVLALGFPRVEEDE